jgi:prolyl-tRNA synthetase
MKVSKLFTKTSREVPRGELSINAQLLIKAGFIDKLMAGVYTYLPLGLRVLKKIENIIRGEINTIGGQEVLMQALHPKEIWQKTSRWQVPEMFKIKNQVGKDYGLGWTHEEIITPLVKKFVHSYKDLPLYIYQIQDKFRDELRAKSGLLRGREFLMKDLYSFHLDEKDLDSYYEIVKKAYFKIFDRAGIGQYTYLTLASGGTFSKYSHEFQTITKNGEDEIFICEECRLAINKEIIEEQKHKCPKCNNKELKQERAIEVGNIFKLGTRFSKDFNFKIKNKDGKDKLILMCSYGVGLGRLMGAVVEVHHDSDGIIWPQSVAPFDICLIDLDDTKKDTEQIYKQLKKNNIEVLWNDKVETAGVKFKDADLIGIPIRLVVSKKTLKENSVEIKLRSQKKVRLVKINQLNKALNKLFKD